MNRMKPVIYRRIVLLKKRTAVLFARTLGDPCFSKSPEFLAAHVKVVAFAGFGPENFKSCAIVSFVEACRGLQTLAIWRPVPSKRGDAEILCLS